VRRFGTASTMTPYFQVINALGRRNVLYAVPGYHEGRPAIEYGPQLPMIPTFGVEWTF
jgi:hypothetical protein